MWHVKHIMIILVRTPRDTDLCHSVLDCCLALISWFLVMLELKIITNPKYLNPLEHHTRTNPPLAWRCVHEHTNTRTHGSQPKHTHIHKNTCLFAPVKIFVHQSGQAEILMSARQSNCGKCVSNLVYFHAVLRLVGRLRCLVGSALDHISLPPEFEPRLGHNWRMFHLWLRFITFEDRFAHLAYLVHKCGRETSITILRLVVESWPSVLILSTSNSCSRSELRTRNVYSQCSSSIDQRDFMRFIHAMLNRRCPSRYVVIYGLCVDLNYNFQSSFCALNW